MGPPQKAHLVERGKDAMSRPRQHVQVWAKIGLDVQHRVGDGNEGQINTLCSSRRFLCPSAAI